MKIVFIENIDPYQNSSGGIATYINKLSQYLGALCIETTLIGSASNHNNVKKIKVDKFINITGHKVSHPKFILYLFLNILFLKFTQDSIIHAQRPDVLVPLALLTKNRNLVCHLHGIHSIAVYHKKGKIQGYIYEILEKIAFKKARLLIAVDNNTYEYYKNKYPYIKHKIIHIPIGVNFNEVFPMNKNYIRRKFGLNKEDKVLIYIGRLDKEKNLYFLIDVFHTLKSKDSSVKMILVGNGREETSLKNYVEKKGIRDIIFMGSVENDKITEILNCADVFVFSSLYEGSPTVIKEAMACGIPVISVDVGDVKEVILKSKYCQIAKSEIADFSEKIHKAFNTIPEPDEIRNSIEMYSNDIVFNRTLNIYKKIIDNLYE